MLYQLFNLQRDPATQSVSFGSSETIGYDFGTAHQYQLSGKIFDVDSVSWNGPRSYEGMLTLGLSIALDGSQRNLPLVKSVEVWSDIEKNRRSSRPVVLERLLYRTDKGMIPYCWRYINRGFQSTTFVHQKNIETVHGQLQGLQGLISVQDPRKCYLDALSEQTGFYIEETLETLNRMMSHEYPLPNFSRNAFHYNTVKSALDTMAHGLVVSPDNHRTNPYAVFYEFAAPVQYVKDPLTRKFPEGELTVTEMSRYLQNAPFDVSIPQAIPIRNPDLLQLHYGVKRAFAQMLDVVRLTDYAVSFRLVNGCVIAHRWEYAVDRYQPILGVVAGRTLDNDVSTLSEVAVLAFNRATLSNNLIGSEASFIAYRTDLRLYDETDVLITKTFGEEALIVVSHKDQVIDVWHIDFAELAFCSMGLSVDSTTFRLETGVNRF